MIGQEVIWSSDSLFIVLNLIQFISWTIWGFFVLQVNLSLELLNCFFTPSLAVLNPPYDGWEQTLKWNTLLKLIFISLYRCGSEWAHLPIFSSFSHAFAELYLSWSVSVLYIYIYIFFLIDNKSFIDEKNNVFTIINTLPLKQIQSNHKERLIEIRKSDKELQCINPQIRDHSNKVLVSKVFNLSIGLSTSSKFLTLRSFHTNHIRQAGTRFQTFEE